MDKIKELWTDLTSNSWKSKTFWVAVGGTLVVLANALGAAGLLE